MLLSKKKRPPKMWLAVIQPNFSICWSTGETRDRKSEPEFTYIDQFWYSSLLPLSTFLLHESEPLCWSILIGMNIDELTQFAC